MWIPSNELRTYSRSSFESAFKDAVVRLVPGGQDGALWGHEVSNFPDRIECLGNAL